LHIVTRQSIIYMDCLALHWSHSDYVYLFYYLYASPFRTVSRRFITSI